MMRSVVAVMCGVLTACSFVFVSEPREPALSNPQVPLDCTTSRVLPVVDAVAGAVLAGLAAGVTYTAIESANDECPNCIGPTGPAILAAFLVVSPWWIASAVGVSDTGQCRAAHRRRQR